MARPNTMTAECGALDEIGRRTPDVSHSTWGGFGRGDAAPVAISTDVTPGGRTRDRRAIASATQSIDPSSEAVIIFCGGRGCQFGFEAGLLRDLTFLATAPAQEFAMVDVQTPDQLVQKKCLPCEGGVDPCPLETAERQLERLTGWYLTHDGQRIRKDWRVKNFMAGLDFFNRCAAIAEADGHHPDLHIEGYRNVSVELWTHAIGGLSENDFILAAKVDQLPIDLES